MLNIVHGAGGVVGEHLVEHPDVPLISFTGSREVGGSRSGERRAAPEERPPRARRQEREKIHSYTKIGIDEGATLLTGGEIATENGLDRGFFYRPTVFADVEPGMRIAQEEIFGPTTALIRASDVDEAIRIANGVRYGLSSSIFHA